MMTQLIIAVLAGAALTFFGIKSQTLKGLLLNFKSKQKDLDLTKDQMENDINIKVSSTIVTKAEADLKAKLEEEPKKGIKEVEDFWNGAK